jgi:hypothetical protein
MTVQVVEVLPFNDEIDILRARILLMADVVDRRVIVEAHQTHQGASKPLHLNRADLPGNTQRINVNLPPGRGDEANWARERHQRDVLLGMVRNPDALVLSCDVDEIVDPEAIPRIIEATEHGPVSLGMKMIYYGDRIDPNPWPAAKAFRREHASQSLSALRLSACPLVRDCGWHLSYIGDATRRRRKVEAFAHAENQSGEVWRRIKAGELGPNGENLHPFDPSTLPPILQKLISDAS